MKKIFFFLSLFVINTSVSRADDTYRNFYKNNNQTEYIKPVSIAESLIIKTVITNGMGTTIPEASQNAAKNALMEVVGSFIDSDTMLKKQTEIINGISIESKVDFTENLNEYSQGSIKSFKILDTKKLDDLYQVKAQVDIRLEDFRAYIKKLAYGSTSVSKEVSASLFAQAISETDNLTNKLELFTKNIINPIRRGEVYNIEIGNIQSLKEWQFNSKYCKSFPRSNKCISNGKYSNWDTTRTFVFPFFISLSDNFKKNMINTLENISDRRIDSYDINTWGISYCAACAYRGAFDEKRDYVISVLDSRKKKKSSYILKDVLYAFKKKNNLTSAYTTKLSEYFFIRPSVGSDSLTCSRNKSWFNPFLINFLDQNGNYLKTTELSAFGCYENSYPISLWEALPICENYNSNCTSYYRPEYSLFASGRNLYSDRLIFSKRDYFIVAELDLEILKSLRKLELKFVQK